MTYTTDKALGPGSYYMGADGTYSPAAGVKFNAGVPVAAEFIKSTGLPQGSVSGSDSTYRKSDGACQVEGEDTAILG